MLEKFVVNSRGAERHYDMVWTAIPEQAVAQSRDRDLKFHLFVNIGMGATVRNPRELLFLMDFSQPRV